MTAANSMKKTRLGALAADDSLFRGAAAVLLAGTLCVSASAQVAGLPHADTHTRPPEAVMADRKDWGADFSFGGTFDRGNTDLDMIGTDFSLFKAWAPSTAYLSGSMFYDEVSGAQIINRGSLNARYDYAVQGPWKVFAFNTQGYNQVTKIDYRTTTGAGPWYDAVLGTTKHGLSLAAVDEYEHDQNDVYYRTARLSFRDMSVFPLSQTAEIRTDFFYTPQIAVAGNYRLSAEIALESIIWKKYLGLKLAWDDEYNNEPQPGVKRNDTVVMTSLTLHFGR
jgi:putative salt-induced outer membrane protein